MTYTSQNPSSRKKTAKYFDLSSYRISLWQQLSTQINVSSLTDDTVKNETIATENTVEQAITETLSELRANEIYWAFPGQSTVEKVLSYLDKKRYQQARKLVNNILNALEKPRKTRFEPYVSTLEKLEQSRFEDFEDKQAKPCFELLIFHPNPKDYQALYQRTLSSLQTDRDEFNYEILFVDNLADALCAVLSNDNIQACLSISNQNTHSDNLLANNLLNRLGDLISADSASTTLKSSPTIETSFDGDNVFNFLQLAKNLRPELEHYYLSELAFAELPTAYFESFNRVFYHEHPFKDLHFHLLNGLRERFNTPFYSALNAYSKKPKGVFHALPISRASSIKDSVWLEDFYQFYGDNVFLAETSSTQGGMDSLLNPKGVIKNAQNKAAKCFGSQETFFVTNGTSTANKIVIQANVQPGDIIFVSSDCHKSIPYGIMLSGAHAVFLQTNAVDSQDLYGAVSLSLIKDRLLALKAVGLLDKVKEIILTNSTFDGLVYDVEHYMTEILAIKPDMIFHWDEAWFAHAHFNALYQSRHAMSVAAKLKARFSSTGYYAAYQAMTNTEKDHHPDPDKVLLRVYATQSTHKTLSCFRQGSMIHVYDENFNQAQFLEALYTHSSTSPNYQILGSLDVARRQMNIEGFALTQKSIRLAHYIREEINNDVNISTVFSILSAQDIYPEEAIEINNSNTDIGEPQYLSMLQDFNSANFVIDPTRITLDIRKSGMQGNAFRQLLIDRYDIQVNKTSEFTVLFIVNIGATTATATYLLSVLREIAEYINTSPSKITSIKAPKQIERAQMPTLRKYHTQFTPCFAADIAPEVFQQLKQESNKGKTDNTAIGIDIGVDIIDMRKAYYGAYQQENIDYILLDHDVISAAELGETWVSAVYVTPYPPGFPVLIPGQIIDLNILRYFSSIATEEIHGYHPTLGLKVFSEEYLLQSATTVKAHEAQNDFK